MNDQPSISGIWNGELTYGEEFGPELHNKKMSFRMELTETDGDVTGICTDTSGTGTIPEPARIAGFIEEEMISFIKQYPVCYAFNEKGEVKVIPDKNPPEINYSGYFNKETGSFEGDWNMVLEFKQLTFGYFENLVSGIWFMKREE